MPQTVKVYCLASFTEDEADEILTQLDDDSHDSYSSSNVRVELIPWTDDRDGGKDDIFRLFFESQETVEDFMFFFDRTSLYRQDFLVADVRAAKKTRPVSRSSSARYPVVEVDVNSTATSDCNSQDVKISIGRCGGDNGWYGNPYSSIKKTYMSLVSGQIAFDEVVYKNRIRRSRPAETYLTSSVLDTCDEAYSAQVRLTQRQAELLCLELQVKPQRSDGEMVNRSEQRRNSRGSFCLPGSQWVGGSANDLRAILSRLKG